MREKKLKRYNRRWKLELIGKRESAMEALIYYLSFQIAPSSRAMTRTLKGAQSFLSIQVLKGVGYGNRLSSTGCGLDGEDLETLYLHVI